MSSAGYQPYPPRSGGGGGDRGGRGGHGRGGRGRHSGPPQGQWKEHFAVQMNLFNLNYTPKPSKPKMWYQYEFSVTPLEDTTERNRDKGIEDLRPRSEATVQRFQEKAAENGSTPLFRQICLNLTSLLWSKGLVLATDQAQMGVSPHPLFDEGPSASYHVKVDRRNFEVRLTLRRTIPLEHAWGTPPSSSSHPQFMQEQAIAVNHIAQCLGILWKEAMTRNFIAIDKNPSTFFLPWEEQLRLKERAFSEYYTSRPPAIAPFIGLSSSVRYNPKGGFSIALNNRVNWLFRGAKKSTEGNTGPSSSRHAAASNNDVPILDQGFLAGIRVDMYRTITDSRIQQQIEQVMSKVTFNVRYTKGPKWEQNAREKGKDEGYIARNRKFYKPQDRMASPKSDSFRRRREGTEETEVPTEPPVVKPRIKWCCADETFIKDGKEYTVDAYFREIYDIVIKYPNMPIIGTKRGYFPVEFLFQEASRAPGGNDPRQVQQVLKYHDDNAGKDRLRHLEQLAVTVCREGEDRSYEALLQKFDLQLRLEPTVVNARRLRAPELEFQDNRVESRTTDGSWNVKNMRFESPANLMSYAVVDFTNRSKVGVDKLIPQLFKAMKGHGMKILNGGQARLPDLVIRGNPGNLDEVAQRLEEAKRRAREVFTKNFFFTNVIKLDSMLETCWVGRDELGLYAIPASSSDKATFTHAVTNAQTGDIAHARIQFAGPGGWKDPSEFPPEELVRDVAYRIDGYGVATRSEVSHSEPIPHFRLADHQVECPAQILVYLPDDRSQLYDTVKSVTDLKVDVNSQCIVQTTVERQKNLDQYCSNIAVKLNTKLFNKTNNARAWALRTPHKWLKELPTMIIGYSFSHGRIDGRASTSIGGCVCLQSPIQMNHIAKFFRSDHKSDGVALSVLKELVKELTISYRRHCDCDPKRVIVFREGGSDGAFDHIRETEFVAIRDAITETNDGSYYPDTNTSDTSLAWCPPISFVVSNKDHNIVMVPNNPENSFKKNVPSGTTVDEGVGELDMGDGEFEVLITPQGGLKGTSKPMLYRCIVNQNKDLPPRCPDPVQCTPMTKRVLAALIYDLSFQYGTATKSPRKVPVLLYSEKIANRVMKYGGSLYSLLGDDGYKISDESQQFIRTDSVGELKKGSMLGSTYGVYDERFEKNYHTPLRPHML